MAQTSVTQTSTTQIASPPDQLESWIAYLRSHSAITRELSAQLQREHGLTLNDYEVLLVLSHSEDGMMRRVDLAETILLTASGITRLLEGLERSGYVCKHACATDARVSYAKLTDEGRQKLSDASVTHLRGIDELFLGRYTEAERATLAELLGRLPVTGISSACS